MARQEHKPNHGIAKERMAKLLKQAEMMFDKYPFLSDRYVKLARRISMKYRVRFTDEQKRMFCRKCESFFREGVNCRTRINGGKITRTCLKCRNIRRKPLKQ